MAGEVWFDPQRRLSPEDAAVDLEHPWLHEGATPPANEWVDPVVDPLGSDETPPAQHPGRPQYQVDAACPVFVTSIRLDPPPCGGLTGMALERAQSYQRACLADPLDWPEAQQVAEPRDWPSGMLRWASRPMRAPAAVDPYRLLANYAHPDAPASFDRDRVLGTVVLQLGGDGRTVLHRWGETGDFFANGLLRLLFLYAGVIREPDSSHSGGPYPLLPCALQEEARRQLLGFAYYGDEPARGPTSGQDAVFWSENHQMLYATAEYLAGQLMPDDWFQPTQHRKEFSGSPWTAHTDSSWGMRGADRMARAYPRLVRWLDHRLMFGFSEWNSPVYYDYEVAGLLNLVDFCDDQALADKATIALDLVLFDLARFSGGRRCGSTAGRAYPSQKISGWNAKIANTLQVLFGMWQVDPRAEEVMEDWRLQQYELKRSSVVDRLWAQAYDEARRADPTDNPGAKADAVIAQWDLDNDVAHDRTRRPPIAEAQPWTASDSPGAHSLATTTRYCVPDLFAAYAQDPAQPWFERSRVSIGFEEGRTDYKIGFTEERDVLAWWSRAGFGAVPTIVGSRDVAAAWGLQDRSPFADIIGMFVLPDFALTTGAAALRVESEGSCLTSANLALWREAGATLSSVQKFRFGEVGRQAHIWQATLDPYVGVYSTYPAARSSEDDNDGPSWWSGNAGQPRVVQYEDALICLHDTTLISYTTEKYGIRSHAWFPVPMFDEAYEVRPDGDDPQTRSTVVDLHTRAVRSSTDHVVHADRGGVWWFGRRGDSYVGLFSAKPDCRLQTTGRWAGREVLCEDRVNVFICQVGSAARFGTFDDFLRACCHAHVHAALGVYQPSNPLVDIDCSYDIPGKGNLWLPPAQRWPVYDGRPLRDEDFPRWENPWTSVPWRRRSYTLRFQESGAAPLELRHDCHTGGRSGSGT